MRSREIAASEPVNRPHSAPTRCFAAIPLCSPGRHTLVEVRRNLARLLDGRDLAAARTTFASDVRALSIVELDEATCDSAAQVAEVTGVRTLDALHPAAAQRVGGPTVPCLTFDVRQAQAARGLRLTVVGV